MNARIEDLYPPLAALVPELLEHAQMLVDIGEPDRWTVTINETSRSVEDQIAAVQRGASNAQPKDAPHCVRKQDGSPCSMAVDFWILDKTTGKLAPDGALVWAAIPSSGFEVGGGRLASGAFFRTIPGGDWPHLEWRGWKELVDARGFLR